MKEFRKDIRGRGATQDIPNRFDKISYEPEATDADEWEEKTRVKTEFLKDSSRTIVAENSSPDIGFRFSVNPYRGCEHGCAYCYARPTHEYLGFSPGLDFESKILVKENAPELLREKLMSRGWKPEVIAMSGVTDCYQPAERRFELTRRCLEVLLEFRNPVGLITKNALVTRDLDLFRQMAEYNGVLVFLSVTTLDAGLCSVLEPRTSRPQARLDAIARLAEAGVPVGVNVAPAIPGLTDHEMPAILKAAADAGAKFSGYVPLRLPLSVQAIFSDWLQENRPEAKEKVLNYVRSLRGGQLNDANFGSRMRGEGAIAANMKQMFEIYSRKYGLNKTRSVLSTESFRRPDLSKQLSLF